jgi:hypothetical protein
MLYWRTIQVRKGYIIKTYLIIRPTKVQFRL